MSLFSRLEEELKRTLIARDMVAIDTLKLIKSIVLLEAKAANLPVATDEMLLGIIYKQIKKYREAAELYSNQNQTEAARLKEEEIAILEALLPAQLGQAELITCIDGVLRDAQLDLKMSNFKLFLDQVMTEVGMAASRGDIARLLKERLEA